MTPEKAAMLRLMSLVPSVLPVDPAELADWHTSMADARTALCLAGGVPERYITAAGYDITDRSYASVRASWVRHIAQWGWSSQYDGPALASAFGFWREARADLAEDGEWFAAGLEEHHVRYSGCCDRPSCDLCHAGEAAGARKSPSLPVSPHQDGQFLGTSKAGPEGKGTAWP
jgi:hypothetical protein